MDFLDDLSKKITSAGQTAAKKTKEIAELTKLNAKVSEEERKLRDTYVAIGKLYVSLHSDTYEADFGDLIAALHEGEKQIEEYKAQIHEIKGVVKCEKCGAEVTSGSAFCNACGAPMPVVNPVDEEAEEAAEETPEAPAEEACCDAADTVNESTDI